MEITVASRKISIKLKRDRWQGTSGEDEEDREHSRESKKYPLSSMNTTDGRGEDEEDGYGAHSHTSTKTSIQQNMACRLQGHFYALKRKQNWFDRYHVLV